MSKHIIELNGKRYDALTGRLLTSEGNEAPAAPLHSLQPQSAPALPKRAASPSHHQAHRKPASRQVQSSKTLMRRAVSKPAKKQSATIKRTAPLPNKVTIGALSPKLSVSSVDPGRVRRAQRVVRSKHVDHFAAPTPKLTTLVQPIAVAAPNPLHAPAKPASAHFKQDIAPVRRPTQLTAAKAAAPRHAVAKPAHAAPAAKKRSEEIFDRAIANAKSHEQKAPKHRRKAGKLLNITAAVAAFVVIGGFLTYVNRSTLQLELASARAGFQAQLPSYQPGGFARQAAVADGRAVKISFVSPNNSDQFTLTQKASDWDSQTLFDEVATTAGNAYQTVQASGRTIYVLDGNRATWVNGGVLYEVRGNAELTNSQISQLATSL